MLQPNDNLSCVKNFKCKFTYTFWGILKICITEHIEKCIICSKISI